MPDPTRPANATDGDLTDSQVPFDATVPPADDPATRAGGTAPEPSFAPAEHSGEVGTFGRYRVLKKLGHGGMGAVYLAFDSSLDRKIALKVMLPQYAAGADARGRFLREARSAAKIKSDHVVTIHDVGEERGVPFIAMEYLLGHPLDQFLKQKGELPLAQVLRIGREAALGLAAAHDLGLVHRDIKPGNLWLEAPKGRVKLLDFGLARPTDDDAHLTNSGAVVGTPAYMSPEQGRGLKVDHRSDLFSLGVMLYRLATGRMPFTGDTTMAVLTSLAVDTPVAPRQLNADLPAALEAVVTRLLAKNPDERFQTATEVADALQEIATGPLPVVVALPVQPFAVGTQTQNVWDGIEASGSVAVPLATSAETEAEPSPAPRSPRAKPERKASKLPMYLAAGAIVTALAVLAVVMLWPPKKPVVAQNDGKEKPPAPVVKQLPTASDPDRKAAEYVLSIGGGVQVNGKEREIKGAADLPKDRFSLTDVLLNHNTTVTDAGLAHFKDCKNLRGIGLDNTPVTDTGLAHLKDCKDLVAAYLGSTPVTDAGLAYLKDCKSLGALNLAGTRVTDAGLALFKDRKNLTFLGLGETAVTDAGLAHLKDCKGLISLSADRTAVSVASLDTLTGFTELNTLDIRQTKFTPDGVKKLAVGLPRCKIYHDGGTIEPMAVADPDRKAAERVLSLKGRVCVNGEMGARAAVADLPKEAFRLTAIFLEDNKDVADADLIDFKDCADLTRIYLIKTSVTAAGLAIFKGRTNVVQLFLTGTPVGDAGLAHFADCKGMNALGLENTAVTDAGLAAFKGCADVRILYLNKTGATDAGFAYFRDCADLQFLNVNGTKVSDLSLPQLKGHKRLTNLEIAKTLVTPKGVAELATAMPQCKIHHDNGIIEARPVADPDRKAAEWALSVGGDVGVEGKDEVIRTKSELPKDRFSLVSASFYRRDGVNDASLEHFRDCDHLTHLLLTGGQVGDAGLERLKTFKCYANLTVLGLWETQITDKGLAHLTDCKTLTLINVKKTKVTAAAVAAFAKAMPQCKIEWDGGIIEPTKK